MSDDTTIHARRDAPVGGQAVIEGVMMRGVSSWAVAVRRPDGEIAVESHPLISFGRRGRVLRAPVVRGVAALAASLRIGFQALSISANAQHGDDREQVGAAVWAGTVVAALALAIGLFFVVPVGITSLATGLLGGSATLFWIVEGAIRTAIFLAYLALLSRQRDLRRLFGYHGAEHKVVAAYEDRAPLVPEVAQRYAREHPRCGTSFLLVVMLVAIVVYAPLGLPAWYVLLATRILGVPLIAGLSFELIKWAGRHRARRWVRAVMWPGMQLQRLTTREPDLEQLAVAVAALEAVLAVEDPLAATDADRIGMEVVA